MKQDSIIFDESRREEIWRRVITGQSDSGDHSMAQILVLEYELLSLSRRLSGNYRVLLNPYIAEKSRRIRRLEARYYILTGARFSTPALPHETGDIRTLYDMAAALSALYTSAAVSAKIDIAAMYREYANAENRFCGRILYIIEQGFLKSH